MFAREGYPFILGASIIAAVVFALALRQRSWPLWLAAIALTVIALSVAWFFRDPVRNGERGAAVAVGVLLRPTSALRVALTHRTVAGQTVIAALPTS